MKTTGIALRLMVLAMPLIIGCDGCRLNEGGDGDTEAAVSAGPPFTSRPAQAYPVTRADAGTRNSPDGAAKPGHWTTVGFGLRSNVDDRRGTVEFEASTKKPSSSFVTQESVDLSKENESKSLATLRPVVLPKGQMRRFDTRLLTPMRGGQLVDSIGLKGEFASTDTTHRFSTQPSLFATMAAQTYHFVVLTDRPERFARLQVADWMESYQNADTFYQNRSNYRLVIPPTQGVLPLAETALDWTSTAVLFWDDIPVRALTSSQVTAIVDWLHFGGTLVVNGPAAAEALNDKAFRNYLAIDFNGNEELPSDNAKSMVQSHSVASDQSVDAIFARLDSNASQVSVSGNVREGAVSIGHGEVLLERRVGRGRVVQSRIDLMSEWMTAWKSYDSFFNSAILARPPRVYLKDEVTEGQVATRPTPAVSSEPTADEPDSKLASDDDGLLPDRQTFVGSINQETHPALNTGVRWLSRDSVLTRSDVTILQEDGEAAYSSPVSMMASPQQLWTHPVSGLGGWKDDSPWMSWSRQTLAGEVGLTIPDSKLVFRSLLIYLVVLIPVNYLVFRLLGRLEWAWLAVIPLSIVGALYVARAAELDVGFARSRNEISLLEVPSGYTRGHLTRVMGLYNSLASRYQIAFDSPDAAISVIDLNKKKDRDDGLFGLVQPKLRFGYEAGITLEDVSVGSNAYRALHVEQIVDLGGSISFQSDATDALGAMSEAAVLSNQSEFDLIDAHVAWRLADGTTRVSAIGDLPSGVKKSVRIADGIDIQLGDAAMNADDAITRLLSQSNIETDTARLVARLEKPLAGMTISPDCQQVRSQTVVLVHLRYKPTAKPIADSNLIGDFRRRQTKLPGDKK